VDAKGRTLLHEKKNMQCKRELKLLMNFPLSGAYGKYQASTTGKLCKPGEMEQGFQHI
jgi:hypothetical protein